MFNKTYHARARRQVRQAGGGRKLAEDALLRLPWAGIFEPFRPFVAVAAASERRKRHDRPLQGVQLELFAEPASQNHNKVISRPDPERPLFDLFPEAYV